MHRSCLFGAVLLACVTRALDPIGANLSLPTNLSLVMPRFKRGTQ
jgi:hypothetical protein